MRYDFHIIALTSDRKLLRVEVIILVVATWPVAIELAFVFITNILLFQFATPPPPSHFCMMCL